jgi:hypothetical protein
VESLIQFTPVYSYRDMLSSRFRHSRYKRSTLPRSSVPPAAFPDESERLLYAHSCSSIMSRLEISRSDISAKETMTIKYCTKVEKVSPGALDGENAFQPDGSG